MFSAKVKFKLPEGFSLPQIFIDLYSSDEFFSRARTGDAIDIHFGIDPQLYETPSLEGVKWIKFMEIEETAWYLLLTKTEELVVEFENENEY